MLTLSRRLDRLGLAVLFIYAFGSLGVVYTVVVNGGHGTVWQTGSVITFLCVLVMAALTYRSLEPSRLRARLITGLVVADLGFLIRDMSLNYFDRWLALAWVGIAIALSGFLVTPTLKRFRAYSWAFIAVALAYSVQALDPFVVATNVLLALAALVTLLVVAVDKREVFAPSTARVLIVAFAALAVSAIVFYIPVKSARIEELGAMFVCIALAKILVVVGVLLYYRERTRDYSLDVCEVLCEHCQKMTTNESHLCGKCGEPLGLTSLE